MLGRAIREFRRRAGLTQDGLAVRSGMDRAYVGAIERGERRPTYGKLLDLAAGLEVEGAELVARAAQHGAEDART
jgi:transcriptional regulator with XRE-family HTH domain